MGHFVCGELFFKFVCLMQPLYASLISQQVSEERSHSESGWRIYWSRPRETPTAGEALLRPPKNWSSTAALLLSISSSARRFLFVLKFLLSAHSQEKRGPFHPAEAGGQRPGEAGPLRGGSAQVRRMSRPQARGVRSLHQQVRCLHRHRATQDPALMWKNDSEVALLGNVVSQKSFCCKMFWNQCFYMSYLN